MSFSEGLTSASPTPKPWCDVSFHDVICNNLNSSGTVTMNGPFHITETVQSTIDGDTGFYNPLLSINNPNPANNNVNGGIIVSSGSSPLTNFVKVVAVNGPTAQAGLVALATNGLILETFNNSPVTILPNKTAALTSTYLSPGQTLTTIQQYSAPGQQYLEVSQTISQSIPNSTNTSITYDTIVRNIGDIVLSGTNTFTVNTTGVYLISFSTTLNSGGDSGLRSSWINVSGTGTTYGKTTFNNTPAAPSVAIGGSSSIYLTSGKTFNIYFSQVSGGAISTLSAICTVTRLS